VWAYRAGAEKTTGRVPPAVVAATIPYGDSASSTVSPSVRRECHAPLVTLTTQNLMTRGGRAVAAACSTPPIPVPVLAIAVDAATVAAVVNAATAAATATATVARRTVRRPCGAMLKRVAEGVHVGAHLVSSVRGWWQGHRHRLGARVMGGCRVPADWVHRAARRRLLYGRAGRGPP